MLRVLPTAMGGGRWVGGDDGSGGGGGDGGGGGSGRGISWDDPLHSYHLVQNKIRTNEFNHNFFGHIFKSPFSFISL